MILNVSRKITSTVVGENKLVTWTIDNEELKDFATFGHEFPWSATKEDYALFDETARIELLSLVNNAIGGYE